MSVPDATPPEKTPTSVYRYYDERDILVYVGVTSRGVSRNREHNTDKDWWKYVIRQDVEHYSTRAEALRRERDLIQTFRPPFNTQHNPGWEMCRAAYHAFVAIPPPVVSSKLVPIPLVVMEWSNRRVQLRTQPFHAALVADIKPKPCINSAVALPNGATARIVSFKMKGPFGIIEVHHKNRNMPPFDRASANLKCTKQVPRELYIKHILAWVA